MKAARTVLQEGGCWVTSAAARSGGGGGGGGGGGDMMTHQMSQWDGERVGNDSNIQ